jgi:hypothetical protein
MFGPSAVYRIPMHPQKELHVDFFSENKLLDLISWKRHAHRTALKTPFTVHVSINKYKL